MIDDYRDYAARVRTRADEINGRYPQAKHPPIILLAEHHEPDAVYEYHRAADICFVSSLHDGMNLVAKEFVAARDDEQGVLVLSLFAGASRELPEALIGNGRIGLLLDRQARIVWGCFPRFDGDPVFCALLDAPAASDERGIYAIELVDAVRHEQSYDPNTAVVTTRAYDSSGAEVEIVDCVPRFVQHDRLFQPMALVRRIRALAGCPRIVVRLRPAFRYGALPATATVGSSHIRYVGPDLTLRLTTDASLTAITEERPFVVDREMTLLLGPDQTLTDGLPEVGRRFIEQTRAYWRDWVRHLTIPFAWQSAVIRAALTLQQNAFDDTGAIVAAMTTSIPEAPDSGRNWDYRHCWLRDAYFVVDALNRLNTTDTIPVQSKSFRDG